MTNELFAIILFANTLLMLSWGIRIGKALQKDIPPVPLAEPVQKATEIVKKIGKRTVRLVSDIKELKALKKGEKEEVDQWN
jgi:hypothetical protein